MVELRQIKSENELACIKEGFTVSFFTIIRVVETEINKSNLLNIESIKSFYDSSFNQLSNITYNMLKSNSVRVLISEKQHENWERIATVDSIVCDIKNNMYNNRMIEKFMLKSNDGTMDISVPKSVKLKINESYKLYFKNMPSEAETYGAWLKNKILSESF